jgi:hypothetical protein
MAFFQQLSKRERYIFIGTVIAVVLLILYQCAYKPLDERLADAQKARDRSREDLRAMNSRIEEQAQLTPKWRQMLGGGLKSDVEGAEGQVLHAINEWAQACRVKLTTLRPDRGTDASSNLTSKKRLPEIAFHVTGEGNMESMARLLWRMQSATMPIRVTSISVNANKEGMDSLSFKLELTTIYAPSHRSESQPAPAPGGAGVSPASSSRAAAVPAAREAVAPPASSSAPSSRGQREDGRGEASQPTPASGPGSQPASAPQPLLASQPSEAGQPSTDSQPSGATRPAATEGGQ